ncbi:hypothetical protein EH222_05790 [candidate division KSB1 bacterium]|nr:MAG: hypothetical protein EH222_05790 [candidate division KSB1 bacterium]
MVPVGASPLNYNSRPKPSWRRLQDQKHNHTPFFRSAACGLRHAACGLRPAACGLRHAVCGLRHAACGLRPAVCGMRPAVCGLPFFFADALGTTKFQRARLCLAHPIAKASVFHTRGRASNQEDSRQSLERGRTRKMLHIRLS